MVFHFSVEHFVELWKMPCKINLSSNLVPGFNLSFYMNAF